MCVCVCMYVCLYEPDLVLNNLQGLLYDKNETKPINLSSTLFLSSIAPGKSS